jgi:cysteinyl-tRNA synthetase
MPRSNRLEDKENEATVIKLVDRAELMREREEKLAAEEKRRLEKEAKKAEAAAKAQALEAQKKIPPWELFRAETDKYSQWDEKGFPTLTAKGEEVPKAQVKKLQKIYQAQEKLYNAYRQSLEKEQ